MLSLPIAFSSAIGVFAPVFSRPMWQHVKVLMTGAVLAPGKRTVTAILQVMGRSTAPDFQTYHRGFCRKFCSEGYGGAVAPVCAEITRQESRTVRPQCGPLPQAQPPSVFS